MDTSVPVLVLSTGYTGHAIARTLGRLGVGVYGVHADPRSAPARSRYWHKNFVWNLAGEEECHSVEWLLRVADSFQSRPILVPTDDRTCLFVADHAAALKEVCHFPDQPPGLARALSSKEQMYALCRRHSIPTAETTFPRSRADVLEFLERATFPVMLKGIDTQRLRLTTGMRMVKVNDPKTLLDCYDQMETPATPNLMLQEFIPGGSEMVWMFNGYFDGQSRCLFGLTGKKLRQYPVGAGVTSLGVCCTNDEVREQTCHFMKVLGYRGILDIGYKYDCRTRRYKLLDVNPRIGATFRLFVDDQGLDVARALYCDLTSQAVHGGVLREGRKWMVEDLDISSAWSSVRQGQLDARRWILSYRAVEEGAWFAWDDPVPFLTKCWRAIDGW